MTQEDKELLLQYLSAVLPYGVICKVEFKDGEGWKIQDMSLEGVFIDECYFTTDTGSIYSKEFKPYLRPISSMTEEEKKEFNHISSLQRDYLGDGNFYTHYQMVDWLNANHFDYRNLIGRGLAIEVTKENNPYKD